MALSQIYEMHRKKVIIFPQEIYEGKNTLPMYEECYLGLMAAAMLFPDAAEAFAAYAARELSRLFSVAEAQSENNLAHVAPHMMVLIKELYGSWANFSDHLRGRGFTEEGKGSLAERIMQGQICGIIYVMHELSEKSLKKSIELAIPMLEQMRQYPELAAMAPTFSFANIQNTLWPRFKTVAWLWAAACQAGIPDDLQRLPLEEVQIYHNIFTDIQLRGSWYGFVDYALRFYKLARDNEQRAEKALPADGEIWQLSFQNIHSL